MAGTVPEEQLSHEPADAPRPEDPDEVADQMEISSDFPVAESSEITAAEAQHLIGRGSIDR